MYLRDSGRRSGQIGQLQAYGGEERTRRKDECRWNSENAMDGKGHSETTGLDGILEDDHAGAAYDPTPTGLDLDRIPCQN